MVKFEYIVLLELEPPNSIINGDIETQDMTHESNRAYDGSRRKDQPPNSKRKL